MSRRVLKYDISEGYSQTVAVAMPVGAKLLCVRTQDPGVPGIKTFLWAETNWPIGATEFRTFIIYPTGKKFSHGGTAVHEYVGTVFFGDAKEVYHVYEVIHRSQA